MLNIEDFLRKRKVRAMSGNPENIITQVPGERTLETQTKLDLATLHRKEAQNALKMGQLNRGRTHIYEAQKQLDECPCEMRCVSVYNLDIALEKIEVLGIKADVLYTDRDFPIALATYRLALQWTEAVYPGNERIIPTMLKIAKTLTHVDTALGEADAEKAFEKTLQMAQEAHSCKSLQVDIYMRYAITPACFFVRF